MLWIVALHRYGTTGALMIRRDDATGCIVELGDREGVHLRLPGCSASAEVLYDGRRWKLRTGNGRMRAIDGVATAAFDAWHVVFIANPAMRAAVRDASERPWFEMGDGAQSAHLGAEPVLLGAARWCAIRVPAVHLPTAAIVLSCPNGATTIFAIPGIDIRVGGERVQTSAPLVDGSVVEVESSSTPCRLVFNDPGERIDRILGVLGGDGRQQTTAPDERTTGLRAWVRRTTARGPLRCIGVDEVVLAVAAVVLAAGFAVLLAARW